MGLATCSRRNVATLLSWPLFPTSFKQSSTFNHVFIIPLPMQCYHLKRGNHVLCPRLLVEMYLPRWPEFIHASNISRPSHPSLQSSSHHEYLYAHRLPHSINPHPVKRRYCLQYTEHGHYINRGTTDISYNRTVGVLHHKPAARESDKDTSQPLPFSESRMWQTAKHQLERCELNPLQLPSVSWRHIGPKVVI